MCLLSSSPSLTLPVLYHVTVGEVWGGRCWGQDGSGEGFTGRAREERFNASVPLTGSQSENIKSFKGSSLGLREQPAEPILGSCTPPVRDRITRSVNKVILEWDRALCYQRAPLGTVAESLEGRADSSQVVREGYLHSA